MSEQASTSSTTLPVDWKYDDIQATHQDTFTHSESKFVSSYRIWGSGPIKALFLHGGPGQSCEDYRLPDGYVLMPTHLHIYMYTSTY